MGETTAPETTFAEWLRAQLDQRGLGVRTFARTINPESPEVARRALNRYLAGARPSPAYRLAIARAWGFSVDELPRDSKEAASEATPFRGGSRRGVARAGSGSKGSQGNGRDGEVAA